MHKSNHFKGSIYMVFDYCEYDLTGLMETVKFKFSEAQVRLGRDKGLALGMFFWQRGEFEDVPCT